MPSSPFSLLLLLLSCFSCVRLCATPEMAGHQAPHPWDSPGKNTGVGCHFLLQCMKVKSESEVTHSCLTLGNHTDCSLPGSSIHGFSRQEYWSGGPLPSSLTASISGANESLSFLWGCCLLLYIVPYHEEGRTENCISMYKTVSPQAWCNICFLNLLNELN